MSVFRPAGLVLASLFALSACATPPAEDPPAADDPAFAAAPPPPAMEDEGLREKPPVLCNPKAGQWAVGQLADEALYAAKEGGRNRTVVMDREYATLSTGAFRVPRPRARIEAA